MTDSNFTYIAVIVDRSGSMSSIQDATQEMLNGYIQRQKDATGKRHVHLVQFDNIVETVYSGDADRCPEYTLLPRAATALHDAMGQTIVKVGEELAAMPPAQRPGQVLVAILTDGYENSSKEFNTESVKKLVKQQEEGYGWSFLYMGANQDAVLTAQGMGLHTNSSLTYSASSAGVRSAGEVFDSYTVAVASAAAPVISEDDRERAVADQS